MPELIRKIDPADIPQIRALLTTVFCDAEYRQLQRLGGMTNHTYRIIRNDGQEYAVRLPGEGTEEMICRADERRSTQLACELGIDAELLYFDDAGRKVSRFIADPQPMNEVVMRRENNILQAARIFKKLHTCGRDTGVRFEVFEMADLYERIIRRAGTPLYEDYERVRQLVMDIKARSDAENDVRRVPCHNDSLMGNWVLSGKGRLYLIDWEYSGMNEAMWDLSCLSIEADYAPEQDDLLLRHYFGRPGTAAERKYLIVGKVYVDYLWTLWGLTRVPFDGAFMQQYADVRYQRLKENIDNLHFMNF